MTQRFIQLSQPITYPSELYGSQLPPLTHWQVCKFEMEFRGTGMPAIVRIWLGLVYFDEGVKYKPPIPGKQFEFVNGEYDAFADSPTGTLSVHADLEKEIAEYLVNQGYINGTVVEI